MSAARRAAANSAHPSNDITTDALERASRKAREWAQSRAQALGLKTGPHARRVDQALLKSQAEVLKAADKLIDADPLLGIAIATAFESIDEALAKTVLKLNRPL